MMKWIGCFGMMFFFSCTASKKVVYFKDMPDTAVFRQLTPVAFSEPVILVDDIVRINIQTLEAPAVAPEPEMLQYLVDKNGMVHLPMIGAVKIAGLTTAAARMLVQERAAEYFKNPTVQLQIANFKVTVLGEVARPSVYTMANERVTLMDALGQAGDLTIFAKRNNILLIRTNGDKKEFVRFDLNSSKTFQSPYFYLKQNDLIYVEPGKGKAAANNAGRTQAIAIAGSVISVLIIALTRL